MILSTSFNAAAGLTMWGFNSVRRLLLGNTREDSLEGVSHLPQEWNNLLMHAGKDCSLQS